MTEEYGEQLQVVGIDTTQADGGQLYQATVEKFQIPSGRRGVPTLVIGEIVLVGSGEIPAQFPDLVQKHLAAGGLDWPDIPGLIVEVPTEETHPQDAETEAQEETEIPPQEIETAQMVTPSPTLTPQDSETPPQETEAAQTATPPPTLTPQNTATSLPTDTPIPVADQSVLTIGKENPLPVEETQNPPSDPVGTTLAAIILMGMLVAFGYTLWRLIANQPPLFQSVHIKTWAVPLLSLIGLGVATYLAYVEITHIKAVCGPVGECNIVQSSPYARMLGVPIAVWGLLNYVTLIVLWSVQRYTTGYLANASILALVGLTIWGTLFSIYLTWLEIFTIHAVCAWCLSSAIISTTLMLLVAIPLTNVSRLKTGGASA
jgi:uncharacterized membrane protein